MSPKRGRLRAHVGICGHVRRGESCAPLNPSMAIPPKKRPTVGKFWPYSGVRGRKRTPFLPATTDQRRAAPRSITVLPPRESRFILWCEYLAVLAAAPRRCSSGARGRTGPFPILLEAVWGPNSPLSGAVSWPTGRQNLPERTTVRSTERSRQQTLCTHTTTARCW